MKKTLVKELLQFIEQSPSTYHVIANIRARLLASGYTELAENARWSVKAGGKYFVLRGGTSCIAFRAPLTDARGFMLTAAHSDSPCFKIKENPERTAAGHYLQLSTEKYGGMLMAPWFDRPLSAAGRVLVDTPEGIETRLVNIDRDLLIIPNLAIHMNRAANDGVKLLANVDTLPLLGAISERDCFLKLAAQAAGCRPEEILGHDLSLYVRQPGTILGAEEEYIASPKLDDLACVFTALEGFLAAKPAQSIPVLCVFDNEEVGSETRQGAGSSFLRDTLRRVTQSLGMTDGHFARMLDESFLLSCDNAHAQHPNHPEFSDSGNCPYLNEGVVLKFNANQRYATSGVSAALYRKLCQKAGAKVQVYANRSDLPGGSTLGSIASTLVPVLMADIGMAQLAMHSCYETAGVEDLFEMVNICRTLYESSFEKSGDVIRLV